MIPDRLLQAVACTLVFAASHTHAQTSAPPIKPGLWESKTRVAVSGQDNSTPAESMARLPPATRAKIEQIARTRGASLDGVSTARHCLTADALADGRWRAGSSERSSENECSTKYGHRDAANWQWHDSCEKAETDTRAHFDDPEHFTIDRLMTPKTPPASGAVFESKITMTWIGGDCGTVR